jgi:hypothetical protein
MTPRQPIEFSFNVRCQFQLRHHWPGKNEKPDNRFVAPSRHELGLFFIYMPLVNMIGSGAPPQEPKRNRRPYAGN